MEILMAAKPQCVAVIPARGGSKGIPRKNLQLLGDDPLLVWPIKTALGLEEIDRIVVSTDDEEIGAVASKAGAEVFWRPAELCQDDSLVVDALRHLYQELRKEGNSCDIMVLLEATSPFRPRTLVQTCINRVLMEDLDSIATFKRLDVPAERLWTQPSPEGHPQPLLAGANPWLPRQSAHPVFALDGLVYAFRPNKIPPNATSLLFGKWRGEMTDGIISIDIDNEEDITLANAILGTGKISRDL